MKKDETRKEIQKKKSRRGEHTNNVKENGRISDKRCETHEMSFERKIKDIQKRVYKIPNNLYNPLTHNPTQQQ